MKYVESKSEKKKIKTDVYLFFIYFYLYKPIVVWSGAKYKRNTSSAWAHVSPGPPGRTFWRPYGVVQSKYSLSPNVYKCINILCSGRVEWTVFGERKWVAKRFMSTETSCKVWKYEFLGSAFRHSSRFQIPFSKIPIFCWSSCFEILKKYQNLNDVSTIGSVHRVLMQYTNSANYSMTMGRDSTRDGIIGYFSATPDDRDDRVEREYTQWHAKKSRPVSPRGGICDVGDVGKSVRAAGRTVLRPKTNALQLWSADDEGNRWRLIDVWLSSSDPPWIFQK